MISVQRVLVQAAVLLVCVTAVFGSESSDVITLTKANFDDVVGKEKFVFVKFFAPWCGHCKSMEDDFKKSAASLKGKAVLADVDATKEEELAKKFNIDGFPTLKLFADGEEIVDYSGARDSESMIRFVERASVPPYTDLDGKDAIEKFMEENKDKNIVFGCDLDAKAQLSFKKASFALMDLMADTITFAKVKDAADVPVDGYKKGEIVLIMDEGKKVKKFDTGSDEALDKFIKGAALPAFQEFTQENAEMYTELSLPIVVGFFKDCEDENCKIMERVAKKNADNGKVVFGWVNEDTLSSFAEYVGLQDADIKICAYSFDTDARYMLTEELSAKFTEEGYGKWVEDLMAGKIEQAIKSQPIPDAEENKGPVYTVVGDTWNEIVEDTGKDVMIAQVAEWCGHCQALKPIYEKVAEVLKDAGVDHIKFCMMDASENDAPQEYKARGFPTVQFFAAGEKQVGKDFDGDRTQKGIIEWLKENSTKKFEFDVSTLGPDPQPAEDEDEEGDEEDEDMYDEEFDGEGDEEKEEL